MKAKVFGIIALFISSGAFADEYISQDVQELMGLVKSSIAAPLLISAGADVIKKECLRMKNVEDPSSGFADESEFCNEFRDKAIEKFFDKLETRVDSSRKKYPAGSEIQKMIEKYFLESSILDDHSKVPVAE